MIKVNLLPERKKIPKPNRGRGQVKKSLLWIIRVVFVIAAFYLTYKLGKEGTVEATIKSTSNYVWNGFIVLLKIVPAIFILAIVLALTCYELAKWNLVFTFVAEGRAKMVVRGDGKYVRTLVAKKGFTALEMESTRGKMGEVVLLLPGEKEMGGWPAKKLGMYYVGIPPYNKIFDYVLKWTTWKIKEGAAADDYSPINEKEKLDSILLAQYAYYVSANGAECIGNMPIDVKLVMTLACINPYLAFIATKDWIRQMNAMVEAAIRAFIGTKTFDEINSGKDAAKDECANFIRDKVETDLKNLYGIVTFGIRIIDFIPPSEYSKIATKAESDVREAEGQGAAQLTKATKDAESAGQEELALAARGRGKAAAMAAEAAVLTANPALTAIEIARALGDKTVIALGQGADIPSVITAKFIAERKGGVTQ